MWEQQKWDFLHNSDLWLLLFLLYLNKNDQKAVKQKIKKKTSMVNVESAKRIKSFNLLHLLVYVNING